LASGFDIDADKFALYCEEWEDLYYDEEIGVSWFTKSPTVHKVIKHGPALIRAMPVPLGLCSEEPAEATNKDTRSYREHHARQDTREHNLEDVFLRQMHRSDPFCTNFVVRKSLQRRPHQPLPREALELLLNPELAFLQQVFED
jgi:hypothetical protein